ncbi:MAG: penicillin-binding transpeptidase domain-containing protein [Planctomycetota bacterium]|nr:penicillin-binding transpeptidase domain-containing protein [Planctomycetota bacterium]
MRIVRSRVPLFFYRRLMLIALVGVVASLLLGARLVELTVLEGGALRARAEDMIRREALLPTWRGSIVDRSGAVLAEDRASWNLAIPFPVLSGAWAREQATRQCILELGKERWQSSTPEEQAEYLLAKLPEWNALVEELLEGLAAQIPLDRSVLESRVESIRQSISRMVAHVHEQQESAFEADRLRRGLDQTEEFRRRPIAEQLQAHVVATGIDDATAFILRRYAQALAAKAARRIGSPDRDPPVLIELVDGQRRNRPGASAVVSIDRSGFPRPLRSDAAAELLLAGVADHITGRTRDQVLDQDLRRRPFNDPDTHAVVDLGGYRPGADMIGARGLEASFEDTLRGNRGIQRRNLETGEVRIQEQVPGRTLELTLDIGLQAEIQALLDPRLGLAQVQQYHVGWEDGDPKPTRLPLGTPLDGAAVVIDIETGELLAMVSSPTFTEGSAMDLGARTTHAPFVHRAVEAAYPPGSIVKPLVYASAVSEGVIAPDERIACTGHLLPENPDALRCWIYKMYGATHESDRGGLDASEAICNSCNIFFYEVGRRMGLERMAGWYRNWGLDEPLDVGLLHEREVRADSAGPPRWIMRSFGEGGGMVPDARSVPAGGRTGEAIMLGIGQGRLTWTPVQAANAYATLARGGRLQDATLIRDPALRGSRRTGSLGLDPQACALALAGLRAAVEDSEGTANSIRYPDAREPIFDIPGVVVWGKTGTATAPARRVDVDGDGVLSSQPPDERIGGLDHAWFVGLAGDERDGTPRYAIAVLVEYGGSGGRVAGPIAAEVVRALVRHGYLQGASDGEG